MHGNVWEWVEDCWHDSYEAHPTMGSHGWKRVKGDCSSRVLRGGSWYNSQDFVRCADRYRSVPDVRNRDVGFRVVCSSRI